MAALREALKAAGIGAVDEIRFAKDSATGQKLLMARLKADPKPTMVFSVDFMSTSASNEAVNEIVTERPFIQAGYTHEDNQVRMARVGEFAALALYTPKYLVRKAISTAVAAALKHEVHSPVEVSVTITESPTNSGVAHMQAKMKSAVKARAKNSE